MRHEIPMSFFSTAVVEHPSRLAHPLGLFGHAPTAVSWAYTGSLSVGPAHHPLTVMIDTLLVKCYSRVRLAEAKQRHETTRCGVRPSRTGFVNRWPTSCGPQSGDPTLGGLCR
jgi:hypothetical protein